MLIAIYQLLLFGIGPIRKRVLHWLEEASDAFVYFMKLFDIEYFNKISQKCENSKSLLSHLKNATPLYFRVVIVPMVAASLCVCIASYMPNWIMMGMFLIEALGFIALCCAGVFIANTYASQ